MIGASPYDAEGYQVVKLETHLHTLHSDGQHGIREMFEACRGAGYGAVALTDHNTQSGIDDAARIADDLGLLFVPGVEVTTFRGHAVVLGVQRTPEWRDLELRGMDALARDVHADGGLLCIAHPAALGSPVCSGCAWDWPIAPESVDLWEVFSASRPNAEVPLALWRQLRDRGSNAAPVAAGDVHSTAAAGRARIATHVYTRALTTDGVMEALRARRLSASRGERIELWLTRASGETVLAGGHAEGPGWTRHCSPGASLVEQPGYIYAERRDTQGVLVGTSAPISIDTSH